MEKGPEGLFVLVLRKAKVEEAEQLREARRLPCELLRRLDELGLSLGGPELGIEGPEDLAVEGLAKKGQRSSFRELP